MAEKKFLDLLGLQKYDEKLKAHIAERDAAILADSNKYFEDNADRFDAAGTAATKVQELADGAVAANAQGVAENKAAIEKLNGDATTEGSVAKAVADAKALIDADVDAVEKKADDNAADIGALEETVGGHTGAISGLTSRADAVDGEISAIKEDIGNVDELATTNKDLVGALNEALAAIGTGGTAAVVAVNAKGSTDDYAQVYEITQGGVAVGTINIPKDLVVESGSVVTDPDGMPAGTYIKLVLANVAEPLFINVGTLVDIYVAEADAAQVQVEIDSNTREISASIVAGSVTATELAADAVITEKIADKNVTKAKLSAEVQASLDKADVAEQNAKAYADGLNTAMDERMDAVEAMLAGDGEGTVDEKIEAAKAAAIAAAAEDATTKANTAESNAKAHATELNNAMDERMQVVEAKAHEHANKDELDLIESGDVAKWNAAQANAEATAAGALAAAKTELEGKIADGDQANKDLIDGHGTRLDALEAKVGDGFVEITDAEIDAMFVAE